MSDAYHAALAWLFFQDVTLSPMGVGGVIFAGAQIHAGLRKWRDR